MKQLFILSFCLLSNPIVCLMTYYNVYALHSSFCGTKWQWSNEVYVVYRLGFWYKTCWGPPTPDQAPSSVFLLLSRSHPTPTEPPAVLFTSSSTSLLWPGAHPTPLAVPRLSIACCYRCRLHWGRALSACLWDDTQMYVCYVLISNEKDERARRTPWRPQTLSY